MTESDIDLRSLDPEVDAPDELENLCGMRESGVVIVYIMDLST